MVKMAKTGVLGLICLAVVLFLGAPGVCESAQSFVDGLGHQVSIETPQRVAALSGSFAEMWLLAGGELAAITQDALDEGRVEEDSPIPVVGDLKSPSVEKLIELEVDFAILSSNLAEHAALYEQLAGVGIQTAYFDVETFDQYLDVLKIMTGITGRADLYAQNGTEIGARIQEAISKSEGREKPAVLFLRAFSTGVRAKGSDSMTGAMLRDLGCVNIADSEESLLEDLSIEKILMADPDFIFATTMGVSEEKAVKSLSEMLESSPVWSELKAVKENRYIMLPKALFHLKPNARWGEAYEMLAEILYGEA